MTVQPPESFQLRLNKSAAESGLKVRWVDGVGTRTYEPVEEPKK